MKVGVTGIYASGKGTVCSMLEKRGARVIDTDIIAREIVEPGTKGLDLIEDTFGSGFIKADGSLDRSLLASKVFKESALLEKLNAITHPIILEEVLKRTSAEGVIYAVNVPLLYETGFDLYMDFNVVVISETGQAVTRGMARDGMTEKEALARIKHQIPLNEKIGLADYVIDNSFSIENTERQVSELWNILNQTGPR